MATRTIMWAISKTVYEVRVEAGACPFCGVAAVTELPPPLLAEQPDDTTHVCNPGLGGCNQGFSKTDRLANGLVSETA